MDRAPAPCTALRILVVDDDSDTCETLAMLLQLHGHIVVTACDGPSALTVAVDSPPDLILLDLAMPFMDGWEVARRLRNDPRTRATYIVSVSGMARKVDRQRSLEAGCDDHWAKPFSMDLLAPLLDARLAARNQRPPPDGS
jgi:CheY-like chemotaxis protein